jgi:FlaA1/EpsC-like NDP-sugar epimerase
MKKDASVLITGGTGSLGKALSNRLLTDPNLGRLAVFSRDELKQYELRMALGADPRVRFFLGDVRDQERLVRALHGVYYVIHTAALKQ